MNNLHRELAPVSEAAWAAIEDEARRTFTLYLAGRRIADVQQAGGPALAAVGTGHVAETGPPMAGVMAWLRRAQPVVELRVPFTLGRQAIDDTERGARDSDWHAAREAARTMAFAEDRTIVDGCTSLSPRTTSRRPRRWWSVSERRWRASRSPAPGTRARHQSRLRYGGPAGVRPRRG
jgi:uncharacterized linocin/CFP29 family protein